MKNSNKNIETKIKTTDILHYIKQNKSNSKVPSPALKMNTNITSNIQFKMNNIKQKYTGFIMSCSKEMLHLIL